MIWFGLTEGKFCKRLSGTFIFNIQSNYMRWKYYEKSRYRRRHGLVEKSPVPIISIVEETAREAHRQHLKKLGLIGTKFTMKGDYYKKPFIQREINIVTPNEAEMDYISEKIASELEHGIINNDTRANLYAIMNRMREEEEIEGVILGCTELPLIIDASDSPVPCLDTMKIHINSIIQRIVS